ncbi:MAG: proton-conducting transporter membrane subunit [Candidatus Acidiferrales bacterium]
MNPVGLALVFVFAFCGVGALLAFVVPERCTPALLAWAGSLAALGGMCSAGIVLHGGAFHAALWTIASLGTIGVSLDRLSALFLFVAAVVVLASSVFSASYMKRYAGHYKLSTFTAWYLLLFASITWILIANEVLGFLLAWEAMSILSYLLVNFEHQREDTNRAGYLMLAMGEAGFVVVEVVLLFLAASAGSLDFSALKGAALGFGTVTRWVVFLLTFFGFGVKAGLAPVNTWLSRAHPVAPANVSAILSGVILNLGLYGIIRFNLDIVPLRMVGAGLIVLAVGTVSALVGILYATTESDLKALLAHSSVENVGIVTVGLGAGIIFAARQHPLLAGMAFIAAFYHMLNHSVYKALLFLGAGAVDDRAGTRDLDRLGGLIRVMPYTAGAFLVGSLAISALPPFNGFVSEWLTLQTLLRSAELPSAPLRLAFALCGAALALTAALAVTCFVKAFAMGFLGISRSPRAPKEISEVPGSAIAPMALLALLCLLLGVLPTYVIPALNRELQPLINPGTAETLVPPFFASSPAHKELPRAFISDFHNLGAQVGQNVLPGRGLVVLQRGGAKNPVVFAMSTFYAFIALALYVLLTWLVATRLTRARKAARSELWAGGIPRLLPEMTYTATGFSNPVRVVFQAIFRPAIAADTRETVAVHFRTAILRHREETYLVDRLFLHPVGDVISWFARLLARMHHGRLNAYVAYILLFLLFILLLFRVS